MADSDWLAGAFEEHREHLRAVAYRLLGSMSDADDAVQDTWLRLTGADASERGEPRRLADDGRRPGVPEHAPVAPAPAPSSRWATPGQAPAEAAAGAGAAAGSPRGRRGRAAGDPADEAVLADSVGLALLVVLDTLTPAERLAFVLHDLFAMPFTEVADVLGRSPDATRQLASRARRRVRGAPSPDRAADLARQREVAAAFLAASRGGDLSALVALLDSGVTLTADAAAVPSGTAGGAARCGDGRHRGARGRRHGRGVPAGPGGRGRRHRLRARRPPAGRAGPDGQRRAPDHRHRRDRRPGPAAASCGWRCCRTRSRPSRTAPFRALPWPGPRWPGMAGPGPGRAVVPAQGRARGGFPGVWELRADR